MRSTGATASTGVGAAVDAAAAVRRLAHAVVGHDVDTDLLGAIATQAGALADRAEAAPARRRPAGGMVADVTAPVAAGAVRRHFAACPIDGPANPLSIPMEVRADDGDVVATATLGPGHEGAPGRAHGGVVAALVDEAMGLLVGGLLGVPAFQGDLRIRYLAPVPIGVPLRLRARLLVRDDRKLLVGLTIGVGDDELVTASGVHVEVDPARAGRPGEPLRIDQEVGT